MIEPGTENGERIALKGEGDEEVSSSVLQGGLVSGGPWSELEPRPANVKRRNVCHSAHCWEHPRVSSGGTRLGSCLTAPLIRTDNSPESHPAT